MSNFKKAFTLAETLIVVAILGIIAVLVIPNLIRNQIESQNRVKVKKAMSVYERALNRIVIENDLRNNTALINYNNSAENANCADTSKYFKASQGQGCMFKTSDGVWWDITNIQRPIIYLNKEGITANNQADVVDHATKTNEQEDKDAYKAFILVGRFDDTIGALRINDKAYEDANSVTEDYDNGTSTSAKMAKLYGFMTNAKSGGAGEGEQSPFAQCKTNHAPTCTVNDIEYTLTDNYYVANLEYPSDYDTQASDCTGSTYEHCSDYGDYYNAAKRYCETSGGRLPTITELQAGDYTNGFFWASEEYNSSNAYFLFNGEVHDNTKSFPLPQVVCVGK